MENDKIIKRIQYAVKIKLVSPLCIASGYSEATDKDVQRNADGDVFIPGTSLAGAMRQYLEEHVKDAKCVELLFGHSNDNDGNMSRIQVSDMYFTNAVTVIVRDGVALKDKVAIDGAKYDMQAIQTGACGMCCFMLTIRESDDEEHLQHMIQELLVGLMNDGIRLGANKNRGFGKIEIPYRTFEKSGQNLVEVYKKEFAKHNIIEWLDFQKDAFIQSLKDEKIAESVLCKINEKQEKDNDSYIIIQVPLRQKGGISIRTYSVVPGEADYEYLKYGKNAIIPGTSWAGAIRARVEELLQALLKEDELVESYMKAWFGFIEEKNSCQSNVIFSESIIHDGVSLQMTRNSINRFTGASLEGALYTEKSYFNGNLVLEMKIRKNYYEKDNNGIVYLKKDDISKYENLVGILLIVAKDIQNGYLAVGGQTAIGRGLFEKNAEKIKILGTDKEETYFIGTVGKLVSAV